MDYTTHKVIEEPLPPKVIAKDKERLEQFWATPGGSKELFYQLYFSSSLKREFYFFTKKLHGMDFELWGIAALLVDKIQEMTKAA